MGSKLERMEHMATKEELARLSVGIREDLARYRLKNKEDLAKLRLELREDMAKFQLASKEESPGLGPYVEKAFAELLLQFKNLEASVSRWLLAYLVIDLALLLSFLGILLERLPAK